MIYIQLHLQIDPVARFSDGLPKGQDVRMSEKHSTKRVFAEQRPQLMQGRERVEEI